MSIKMINVFRLVVAPFGVVPVVIIYQEHNFELTLVFLLVSPLERFTPAGRALADNVLNFLLNRNSDIPD